jgi:beta-lactamase regulating signal transducer with metallopeptidase domain
MTPSPVVEALLVVLAGVMAAWMVSYLLHSTLLTGAAALLSRVRVLAATDRARLWRFVIVAPFVTATVQVTGLAGPPLVSTDVAGLLPQAFVDWRLGIVGASTLVIVVVTLAVGWMTGVFVLRRLLGRRRPAPKTLQHEVSMIAAVVGCRPPRVTVSDTSHVPAAVGLSEVCVPAVSIDEMPPEERRSLLAHEVGHLVARDPLWFAVAGTLSRIAAFQPLNRWVVSQMRVASEEAADDFAAQVTGDPAALARALASLASMLLLLPGGVAATGSPIVSRVSRLLDDARPVRSPWRRPMRRFAALIAIATIVVAAPGLTASADKLASRLPWLAPSRDEPNARMLEVRQFDRGLRDFVRRVFR